ncbi:hypothetical protein PMAYCL1PPCAC_32697, partial [Pristionchus mayeri]
CGCSRWIDFAYKVGYDSPWPAGRVTKTFHARLLADGEDPLWKQEAISHFEIGKEVLGISSRSALVVHPGGSAFRWTVSELKKRRAEFYD